MHTTTTTTPAAVPDVCERCYMFSPDYLAVRTKVDTGEKGSLVEFRFGERFRALIVPVRAA
jgi:hypothetical protein